MVTPDVVQGESQKVEPVEKNVQNVNVTGETETEEVVVSEPVVERQNERVNISRGRRTSSLDGLVSPSL